MTRICCAGNPEAAAALRQALGPGYGFAGPSDQVLRTITEPTWRWDKTRR